MEKVIEKSCNNCMYNDAAFKCTKCYQFTKRENDKNYWKAKQRFKSGDFEYNIS